jgi:hypothetical protein
MNDDSSEAAQIERELEILRSRYALMERSAKVAKIGFIVFLATMVVLAGVGIAVGNMVAVFVTLAILVIAVLLVVAYPNARWIDIVTPERFAQRSFSHRTSEAEIVETQIADREQRLAQIHGTARSDAVLGP